MIDQKLELSKIAQTALKELIDNLDPMGSFPNLQKIELPSISFSPKESEEMINNKRKELGIINEKPSVYATSIYDRDMGHGVIDLTFYSHEKSMVGLVGPLEITPIVLKAPPRIQKAIMMHQAAHLVAYTYDSRYSLSVATLSGSQVANSNSRTGCVFFNERLAYATEGRIMGRTDFDLHLDWLQENSIKDKMDPATAYLFTMKQRYDADQSGNFEMFVEPRDLMFPIQYIMGTATKENNSEFLLEQNGPIEFIKNLSILWRRIQKLPVEVYPVKQ